VRRDPPTLSNISNVWLDKHSLGSGSTQAIIRDNLHQTKTVFVTVTLRQHVLESFATGPSLVCFEVHRVADRDTTVNFDISSRFLDYTTREEWQVDAGALDANVLVVPLFYSEWPRFYPVKRLNHGII
jgi:hypothetical protein